MQYSISYYVYLLLTFYKAKQIHNFVLLLQCRTPTDRGWRQMLLPPLIILLAIWPSLSCILNDKAVAMLAAAFLLLNLVLSSLQLQRLAHCCAEKALAVTKVVFRLLLLTGQTVRLI